MLMTNMHILILQKLKNLQLHLVILILAQRAQIIHQQLNAAALEDLGIHTKVKLLQNLVQLVTLTLHLDLVHLEQAFHILKFKQRFDIQGIALIKIDFILDKKMGFSLMQNIKSVN